MKNFLMQCYWFCVNSWKLRHALKKARPTDPDGLLLLMKHQLQQMLISQVEFQLNHPELIDRRFRRNPQRIQTAIHLINRMLADNYSKFETSMELKPDGDNPWSEAIFHHKAKYFFPSRYQNGDLDRKLAQQDLDMLLKLLRYLRYWWT